MFSITEAAVILRIHPATIRRWHLDGTIRYSRKSGGHRRITTEEIQRIIDGKKRRYKRKNSGVATYVKQKVNIHNFS